MTSSFIQYVAIGALCQVVLFVVAVRLLIRFKMAPVEHIVGSFHQVFHAAYFYRSSIVHLSGFHLFGHADKLLKKTLDDCARNIMLKTKESKQLYVDETSPETIRLFFDAMTVQVDREYVAYFRIALAREYEQFMKDPSYQTLVDRMYDSNTSTKELLQAYEYFSMLGHIELSFDHARFEVAFLRQISAASYNAKFLYDILHQGGNIYLQDLYPALKFPPIVQLRNPIQKEAIQLLSEVMHRFEKK